MDTAFLDRMHCYIPGWEIPKFRPEHFTDDYGFITDYLAEFIRELRKEQHGDALDKYFKLGKNLNQRDTIAVRKMIGGLVKLIYPNGEYSKEEIEEIIRFALEMRRRVKEQLKKLGGMEFYDVNFSYIDNDTFEEHYVSVPEQGGGKLIPEGMCNPGQVYTVARGKSGMLGVFRLESQMLPGNGKFDKTGLGSDREAREAVATAYNFLKANGKRISSSIREQLEDKVNSIFERMYHGHRRVAIDMRYQVSLLTTIADREVAAGESEGSNRVKNFAFIAGLVALAKEKIIADSGENGIPIPTEPYPLVMDAPFSNADETHTANISKILPEVAEQVIMFVMQKDWNYAQPVMANKIGATYQLQKQSETYTILS